MSESVIQICRKTEPLDSNLNHTADKITQEEWRNQQQEKESFSKDSYEDTSGVPFQALGLMKNLKSSCLPLPGQVRLMCCHQSSQATALFMMLFIKSGGYWRKRFQEKAEEKWC